MALRPSKPFEFLLERLYFWIVEGDEHVYMSNAVELLRTRRILGLKATHEAARIHRTCT